MEYLPLQEAAKRVRIGKTRLYELVHTGKIPHVKLGRRIMVRLECVNEWLRSQEVGAE